METIGKLFGGEAKAKVIRLFLFNPEAHYKISDVCSRTAITPLQAKSVLAALTKIGLIKSRLSVKKTTKRRHRTKKIKEAEFFLAKNFPYIPTLSGLVAEASIKADKRLSAKLMQAGKVKVIIASGIFTRQSDARLDLLIVGDDISEAKLSRIIKSIESDTGRDLTYANLTTADFRYRLGLSDRLIRDVVDFPYIVLLDRIGFQTQK